MKRYQFRLEAVLKVRKMEEETCRNALGLLMVERQRLLDQVESLKAEIAAAYRSQESAMGQGMRARHAAFFPVLVEGKDAHIKHVHGLIEGVEKQIEERRVELQRRRADLKAVENLREKDFLAWKKAANKEMDQKVEEMVQNWDAARKSVPEEQA